MKCYVNRLLYPQKYFAVQHCVLSLEVSKRVRNAMYQR